MIDGKIEEIQVTVEKIAQELDHLERARRERKYGQALRAVNRAAEYAEELYDGLREDADSSIIHELEEEADGSER